MELIIKGLDLLTITISIIIIILAKSNYIHACKWHHTMTPNQAADGKDQSN